MKDDLCDECGHPRSDHYPDEMCSHINCDCLGFVPPGRGV